LICDWVRPLKFIYHRPQFFAIIDQSVDGAQYLRDARVS
jgi:hypothetical protein